MATIKVKKVNALGRVIDTIIIPERLMWVVIPDGKEYSIKSSICDSSKAKRGIQPGQMAFDDVVVRTTVIKNPPSEAYEDLVAMVLADVGLEVE